MRHSTSDKFPLREWKLEERSINLYEVCGEVEKLYHKLKNLSKGMKNAWIELDRGYEDDEILVVKGYIRRTTEEIAAFDKASVSAREKNKKMAEKKRKKEIDQLKMLRTKYPEIA